VESIRIFDTTLRDGEQSPGAAMTPADRLRIAQMLEQLGVDVIEAGFPAASPTSAASVAEIARTVRGPIIAALARCTPADVEIAAASVAEARAPRIHVFLATSDLHLERKLGITRGEALERIRSCVTIARTHCADIEFSAEDATRTDPAFLIEAFTVAVAAGATTINIPDTVGYTMPADMARIITDVRAHVPGIEGVTISVHTHDDLGMATANALAAIGAGARQVECTINGIGERAGNCALEEIAIALRVRSDAYPFTTSINAEQLADISETVAGATRMPVQKNKAVVGAHAFAHESGIHQDGVLKDRRTYEIVDPAMVGARRALPLSRNSGKRALFSRLDELGITFDAAGRIAFAAAFAEFIAHRTSVTNADLITLAQSYCHPELVEGRAS
jgi:2-isopropylmalate synthase